MKKIKNIGNILYWLLIIFLIITAVSTSFTVVKAPGGYRLFVVQSGSMEPAIKTGSVVLVVPQTEYKERDVITFLANATADLKKPDSTITHRIFAVHDDEGRATFTTKGDANNAEDRETVAQNRVLGKVLLSVPFIGYLVAFAKTQAGLIILIIIPATLIAYTEIMSIKKEIVRMIQERKNKKAEKEKIVNIKTKKFIKKAKKHISRRIKKEKI